MSQGPGDPGGGRRSVEASKQRGHKPALAFLDCPVAVLEGAAQGWLRLQGGRPLKKLPGRTQEGDAV